MFLRRSALAAAVGVALLASSAPAGAQWISNTKSSPDPPKPGELGTGEGFLLLLGGLGATVPIVVGGVWFSKNPPVALPAGAGLGFALGGSVVGIATAAYLPFLEPGSQSFAYSLVGGMYWGVAGMGVGGLAAPTNWHAFVLGGGLGYTTGAVIRGVVTLARGVPDPDAGLAETLLGGVGAAACIADAASGTKTGGTKVDIAVGSGCAALAVATVVHGLVQQNKPKPPTKPVKTSAPAWTPLPWAGSGAAGLALARVW